MASPTRNAEARTGCDSQAKLPNGGACRCSSSGPCPAAPAPLGCLPARHRRFWGRRRPLPCPARGRDKRLDAGRQGRPARPHPRRRRVGHLRAVCREHAGWGLLDLRPKARRQDRPSRCGRRRGTCRRRLAGRQAGRSRERSFQADLLPVRRCGQLRSGAARSGCARPETEPPGTSRGGGGAQAGVRGRMSGQGRGRRAGAAFAAAPSRTTGST